MFRVCGGRRVVVIGIGIGVGALLRYGRGRRVESRLGSEIDACNRQAMEPAAIASRVFVLCVERTS